VSFKDIDWNFKEIPSQLFLDFLDVFLQNTILSLVMLNKSDMSIHDTLQLTIKLPNVISDVPQQLFYFYLSGCDWYIKSCVDKVPNLLLRNVAVSGMLLYFAEVVLLVRI